MEVKGFNENGLSEKSKEALQSETWNQARAAMKTEIKHFTALADGTDNAYGYKWNGLIREYLKTRYNHELAQCEVVFLNVMYKVLKRDGVTSFYDAYGNTLFDVENVRLAEEYDWIMNAPKEPEEETECKLAKQIEECRVDDSKCSGGIDEKCEHFKKASKEEEQETEKCAEQEEDTKESEESDSTSEKVDVTKFGDAKPAKERAKEKLEADLKKAKDKSFAEPIIAYLLERCAEDEGLSIDVTQEHKSWEKCFSYIFEKAKKQETGNSAVVREDVVYEWAEDYYHLDDKALEEKKRKEAVEYKNKQNQKKVQNTIVKTQQKMESAVVPEKEISKSFPKKKELEGQFSLFDLM